MKDVKAELLNRKKLARQERIKELKEVSKFKLNLLELESLYLEKENNLLKKQVEPLRKKAMEALMRKLDLDLSESEVVEKLNLSMFGEAKKY